MTTIAIKDGIMACDSRITSGNVVNYLGFEKVMRHDDCYYGFAGDCHQIALSKAYIKGEIALEHLPDTVALEVVCMPKKGKPYLLTITDGCVTTMDIKGSFSIGSGSSFAMAAMECGATARQAVDVAKKYDIYSGGNTKAYTFNVNPAKKSKAKPVSKEKV